MGNIIKFMPIFFASGHGPKTDALSFFLSLTPFFFLIFIVFFVLAPRKRIEEEKAAQQEFEEERKRLEEEKKIYSPIHLGGNLYRFKEYRYNDAFEESLKKFLEEHPDLEIASMNVIKYPSSATIRDIIFFKKTI